MKISLRAQHSVPKYSSYINSDYTTAARKVTPGALLTKQEMRKNCVIYKKCTYLSCFWTPPELRHLYWGISFCKPVSEKSAACELSHVLTLSINLLLFEALWSQSVLEIGKQVVVAWSEIRALRTVVKQLPVEMLQQCSSASSCLWTLIVTQVHYTGSYYSTPFVLYGPTQFVWCFAVHL
jgi:hypothetical protein